MAMNNEKDRERVGMGNIQYVAIGRKTDGVIVSAYNHFKRKGMVPNSAEYRATVERAFGRSSMLMTQTGSEAKSIKFSGGSTHAGGVHKCALHFMSDSFCVYGAVTARGVPKETVFEFLSTVSKWFISNYSPQRIAQCGKRQLSDSSRSNIAAVCSRYDNDLVADPHVNVVGSSPDSDEENKDDDNDDDVALLKSPTPAPWFAGLFSCCSKASPTLDDMDIED